LGGRAFLIAAAFAFSGAGAMGADKRDPNIIRHRSAEPFRTPEQVKPFGLEIEDHLVRVLGPYNFVFREIVSDQVRIDVLQFPPTEARPFWTFVTSGMSDLPMSVPNEVAPSPEFYERAEMVIAVPEDWVPRGPDGALDDVAIRLPEKWWPIKWLSYLARFPHKYRTALWIEHSIPNGNPAQPLGPGTSLTGFVLAPPATWPTEARMMRTTNGTIVTFLAAYPLYTSEMDLKLSDGFGAIYNLLISGGVTEVIEPNRANLAPGL
jgi:hypothetical protein